MGGVRSLNRHPGILKCCESPNGYLVVYLQVGGKKNRKRVYVHRLVLCAFVGPCPKGQWAAHNNGIRKDNRLPNLRWDTVRANHADKLNHGTQPMGEKHWNAILTVQKVQEIRSSDKSDIELGKAYGVSDTAIYHIRKRNTWRHV